MLNFMRKNSQSWLMLLLFTILIFVFAVNFGPWAGHLGGALPYAAEVNGEVVTTSEFQSAYSNQFRQMQQFRPNYTAEQAERDGLKNMILDQLVAQELLAQMANRQGLVLPDKELARTIQLRFFGKDKPFNKEEYQKIVNGYFQLTEPQFEQQLRRELLAQKVAETIASSAFVTDQELKDAYFMRHSRAALDVLEVKPTFFKPTQAPLAADIEKFAKEHEANITSAYQKRLSIYQAPAQVRARHILIKVPQDASTDVKTKARQKVEGLRKRIVEGKEDFGKVAGEVSEDSTKARGGDLGFFGPGQMVKPFEEATFKLKVSEVSPVVETQFGFHLIQVTETKPAVDKKLADVRTEIAKSLMADDAAEKAAKAFAENAHKQLKSGKSFAQLALSSKGDAAPKVISTDLFMRDAQFIPKVGVNPELVEAAFGLTKQNPVADRVFQTGSTYYVARLKSLEVADMTKFDAEKEQINATLLTQRKRQVISDFITDLKKNAKITYNEQVLRLPGQNQN